MATGGSHWISKLPGTLPAGSPPKALLSVDFEHVGSEYWKDTTFEVGFFYIDSTQEFKLRLQKAPSSGDQYEADPDNIEWLKKNPATWEQYEAARTGGLSADKFRQAVEAAITRAIELAGSAKNLRVVADMHGDLARLAHLVGRPIDCILGPRNPPVCTTDMFIGALGTFVRPGEAETAMVELTRVQSAIHSHRADDDAERTGRALWGMLYR